jgi:hypothetical protein
MEETDQYQKRLNSSDGVIFPNSLPLSCPVRHKLTVLHLSLSLSLSLSPLAHGISDYDCRGILEMTLNGRFDLQYCPPLLTISRSLGLSSGEILQVGM